MNNKKHFEKDPSNSLPVTPKPGVPPVKNTVDAMLDKMSILIRQRDAWANLAKLLLYKCQGEVDAEIRSAFRACTEAISAPSTPDSK
jgi:hypothetical protein